MPRRTRRAAPVGCNGSFGPVWSQFDPRSLLSAQPVMPARSAATIGQVRAQDGSIGCLVPHLAMAAPDCIRNDYARLGGAGLPDAVSGIGLPAIPQIDLLGLHVLRTHRPPAEGTDGPGSALA